jgi:rSAM/selenodomain-associated transferase 1
MTRPDVALLVLAKEPVAGRVKTRLCPPCSLSEAAELAAAALTDTLGAVAATPVARRVLVVDGRPPPWLPAGFEVMGQRGGGLDERLAAAFDDVGGCALLVGMDTPQLTPALLESAVDRLTAPGADAVIGPAADGGWWGLGLRRPDPRVFVGVPMSTPATGAAQLERLRLLGLDITLLPELIDVDDFTAAAAVAAGAPHTRFAATFGRLFAPVPR